MIQLIDTHTHLYMSEFSKHLHDVLERAQANHVTKMYMPNIDETTIDDMLNLASLYPFACLPMIGIHPCHIKQDFIRQLYIVEQFLATYPFVGIGEIGIDLYHDKTFLCAQKEAFAIQLRLAKQYNLPVSIHCRDAFNEVISIIEQEQNGLLKGVIHCFTGNLTDAEKCIQLGFYLGISGMVTFSKSNLAHIIQSIDLSNLVLETDSPYLSPEPYRGKRNEPAHLLYIAHKVAGLKKMSLEEVALATTRNTQDLFSTSWA